MKAVKKRSIVLLCAVLFAVDLLSFYWLGKVVTLLNQPMIKTGVDFLFWLFSLGLISSILILKWRLDSMHPQRKQLWISSLYGITISSFVPKLFFVVWISILYYTDRAFSLNQSMYFVSIAGVLSGVLPFVIIQYGIFKSLYRFKIHRVQLPIPEALSDLEGLKIVQISDLHLGSFNYRYHILERAVGLINGLRPDLICFTGDLVNNYAWELKGWSSVLSKLHARYGKYSVLGNHDYGYYGTWKNSKLKTQNASSIAFFHKKIGFELLQNKAENLQFGKTRLSIVGVENWGLPPFPQKGDLAKALKDAKTADYKLLLSHDPSHWTEQVKGKTDIQLTLSGHTHGMQAGVQLKEKQWSPIQYKYKHWAGLHKENGQYLYVNRGLGWLGFPGRIGMRPEITFFEFVPAQGS